MLQIGYDITQLLKGTSNLFPFIELHHLLSQLGALLEVDMVVGQTAHDKNCRYISESVNL